jgi:hypothetical protein
VFLAQDVHVELVVGTPFRNDGNVRFKPNNDASVCTVVLSPFNESTDPEELNLELAVALIHLLAHLSARPQDEFMAIVERAFAGGLTHKLHLGRRTTKSPTSSKKPTTPPLPPCPSSLFKALRSSRSLRTAFKHRRRQAPATIMQSPSRTSARTTSSCPRSSTGRSRALADPSTLAGLHELRRDGWLDWHLLVAIANVAFNVRAGAAGLLKRSTQATSQQRRLATDPESDQSVPVPLAVLTPDRLRSTLEVAIFAIGQRRWHVGSAVETPNIAAFKELLEARYGYAVDDVPHRDLLSDALADDGTLLPLVDT